MHKEMKVHNTGNGCNVHASTDDEIGSMDIKVNVKLNNQDDIPLVQAAWDEAAAAVEAAADIPSAIRAAVTTLLEHVAEMEQKTRGGN